MREYNGIKQRVIKISMLLLSVLIAGCSSTRDYDGSADSRWSNFKSWTKITQDRTGTGDPTGLVSSVHKGREGYRDVYVNNVALATIQGSAPYQYPLGSVIVKEQFVNKAAFLAQKPTDLTIMVKVADSGNVEAKNWAWSEGYKAPLKTDNAFCSGCHIAALKDDFVFTNEDFLSK